MASPPERRLADPLLEHPPEEFDDAPAASRAPVGNSILTLVLAGILVVVGIAIWWLQRPSDLTERLEGREWIIVEADGQPATSDVGTTSRFELAANGEVNTAASCNTRTGEWEFDEPSQELHIDWVGETEIACPDDTPQTYAIGAGPVDIDGDLLRVETDVGTISAFSPTDREVAQADDLAGRWRFGESVVDFGPRGLLRVDECTGSWMPSGDGIGVSFDDAETERVGCLLPPTWTGGEVLLPYRFDDSLYLYEHDPFGSLDGPVYRLDFTGTADTPLLDGP